MGRILRLYLYPENIFGLRLQDWRKRYRVKGVVNMENEKINHPAHYCQGGIECIDAIEAATTNLTGIEAVCTANVIKYIWRWKEKNGTEDLRKAEWYLKRLTRIVENKETFKKPRVIVNEATGEYCVK